MSNLWKTARKTQEDMWKISDGATHDDMITSTQALIIIPEHQRGLQRHDEGSVLTWLDRRGNIKPAVEEVMFRVSDLNQLKTPPFH